MLIIYLKTIGQSHLPVFCAHLSRNILFCYVENSEGDPSFQTTLFQLLLSRSWHIKSALESSAEQEWIQSCSDCMSAYIRSMEVISRIKLLKTFLQDISGIRPFDRRFYRKAFHQSFILFCRHLLHLFLWLWPAESPVCQSLIDKKETVAFP